MFLFSNIFFKNLSECFRDGNIHLVFGKMSINVLYLSSLKMCLTCLDNLHIYLSFICLIEVTCSYVEPLA